MTFEQKIRKALPHLSALELWFIEVDYDHTMRSATRLEMYAVARSCSSMVETIQKERSKRFPDSRCPFPCAFTRGWDLPQSEKLDALYERIRRGAFAAPEDLNAGQRPGLVGCASKPPAGGARYSAFNKPKEQAL